MTRPFRHVAALLLLSAVAVTSAAAQGMPDRRQVLVELRKEYPATITKAQAGELLARVAFKLRAEGFGVYRKDGGNRCPLPAGGTISCDILLHKPSSTWCDVLGDAPDDQTPVNTASATWCPGTPGDMTNFIAVTVDPSGHVDPPAPPGPPAEDLAPRVKALELMVSVLQGRVGEVDARIDTVETRVDALPGNAITEERIAALIADAFARAIVDGKTGTDRIGLQHQVHLRVTLEPR